MRPIHALALLALLAACSEQQMCISRVTQDLRVVNDFVAEAEGNIARGYALETYSVIEFEREACGVDGAGDTIYCRVPDEITRTRPKAIDLDAERAKLAALIEKRDQLAAQAERDVAACRAAYPE